MKVTPGESRQLDDYYVADLSHSDLMYAHRQPAKRVEVVDLDPYGTAAPFIDAAIGCIADGGELSARYLALRQLT